MSHKRERQDEANNSAQKRPALSVLADITNKSGDFEARKAPCNRSTNEHLPCVAPQQFQHSSLSTQHQNPSQNTTISSNQQQHPGQSQQNLAISLFTPLLPIHQIEGFKPFSTEPDEPLMMFPHDDIDQLAGSDDPIWMTMYIQDIYAYLRKREHSFDIENPLFLNSPATPHTFSHPELTPEMRKVLINWLHEVSTEFKLKGETLFLTVNYLDRFLSKTRNIPRTKFQLVGVTCLFIAIKYEQIVPMTLDQLVHLTADTYTREDMIVMESEILNILNFELTIPTVKAFLARFIKASRFDPTRTFLANFLAELSLLKYEMVRFPPSVIAASCVYLTLAASGRNWTPTLSYYSQYGRHSQMFAQCIQQLFQFWFSERVQQRNSVFEKYSLSEFHSVALTPPSIHS